jgi:hypothetical protein
MITDPDDYFLTPKTTDGKNRTCEVVDRNPNRPIQIGDYVTRGSWDIQYVEHVDEDCIRVVCIIPPDTDWIRAGQYEDNLTQKYSHINRHYLRFAKAEHEKLKAKFPNGWIE